MTSELVLATIAESKELKEKFDIVGFKSKPIHDGKQMLCFFSNGYGASIVRHSYSYGGNEGLFELAVLEGTLESWSLTYETSVTDDVLGYLSEQEVFECLEQIKNIK